MARIAWLPLLLVLGASLPAMSAAAAVPVHPIVASGSLVVGRDVTLTIPAAEAALGPNVIVNPSFGSGVEGWAFTGGDLGSSASVQLRSGQASLEAKAARAGTMAFAQTVPLDANASYGLRFRAADLGDNASRLDVVLVEKGSGASLETTIGVPLVPFAQAYQFPFKPRSSDSTSVTLRFEVPAAAGQAVVVRLDDIALQPIPAVKWTVNGGDLLLAQSTTAHVRFTNAGSRTVTASATHHGAPLWNATGTFGVAAQAGAAIIVVANTTRPLNVPTTLDASTSIHPGSTFVLDDERFTDIGGTWQSGTSDPDATATATKTDDPRGAAKLVLKTGGKPAKGFLAQTLLVKDPGSATIAVRVRDTGAVLRYELVVREVDSKGGSKDARFQFPAVGSTETPLVANWTQSLTNVQRITVFLRIVGGANDDASAIFTQPRLLGGLRFEWLVDGKVQQAGRLPTFTFKAREEGKHTFDVRVTDKGSTVLKSRANVTFRDDGFVWADALGMVVPSYPSVSIGLDGITRAEGRELLLPNGDFADGTTGWTAAATKGIAFTFKARSEGGFDWVRLNATATKDGEAWLEAPAEPTCKGISCTLSFQYRSPVPIHVELRSGAGEDGKPAASIVTAKGKAATAWRDLEATWTPSKKAGALAVRIGADIEADETLRLDLRAVSLEPTITVEAKLDGKATGNASLPMLAPGEHKLEVKVANPFGQEDRFTRRFCVLPVQAFRTQDGHLGLSIGQGNGSVQAGGDAYDLAAPRLAPGADGFEADDGVFLRFAANATSSIKLGCGANTATYSVKDLVSTLGRPDDPAPSANLTHSGWRRQVGLGLELGQPDPSIRRVYATLVEDGKAKVTQTLRRDGLAFTGLADLPLDFSAHNYTVVYHVEDGWGVRDVAAEQSIVVARNEYVLGCALLAGAALLLLGAAFGVRHLRSRP